MENIIYLVPIAVLQILLTLVSLFHVLTHPHYKHGNKVIWILVSFISFIGPILYFAIGRGDE